MNEKYANVCVCVCALINSNRHNYVHCTYIRTGIQINICIKTYSRNSILFEFYFFHLFIYCFHSERPIFYFTYSLTTKKFLIN